MNRRGWVAAALGGLLLVSLLTVGRQPASGSAPEGGGTGGTRLTVTPSDGLGPVVDVDLLGEGFFPFFDTTGRGSVTVMQCVSSTGACGAPKTLPVLDTASFSGTLTVARMLSLSNSTVDCVEVGCAVTATAGDTSASHHLSFAVTTTVPPRGTLPVAPTTTSVRATTTSTTSAVPPNTTTTSPRPVPGVAIPTTRATPLRSSTTLRPSTSTSAPPTTTTTVAPPADNRPPLIAVTSANRPAGPPGGGLQVEGGGYRCDTVYFFFDGTRVGSGTPNAAGAISKGGISVPGDAGTGRHEVTSSCEASGVAVEQASFFQVLPVTVHRPAFVTSLPLPGQVSLRPAQLLTSAAVAVGALLLIAFPFELFNSTMEENYDEIRAWFHMGPRDVIEKTRRRRTVTFFGWTAVTAVACGFLSPDFGLNMTSLVLAVGMFVALLVMAVVFSLPADIGIHRQFGEWGKLNFLPGSVVVSIVLVGLSRLFDFQPGYFYGALAGLAFRSALSEPVQGRMTAANWAFSLAVSAGAWFARVPVSAAAGRPGASIWWIGLEICLAMIFLWGVEGLAVAMLPLHFLDGRKVFRWSRAGWAVLFFLGLFATFHVLLSPGSGYVGNTTGGVAIGVMVLYVGFGLGSVLFWAYFRYRPRRWALARA